MLQQQFGEYTSSLPAHIAQTGANHLHRSYVQQHLPCISMKFESLMTSFSILNSGIPKVSRPPISGRLSKTTGLTPFLTKISAQPRPAGPAFVAATFPGVWIYLNTNAMLATTIKWFALLCSHGRNDGSTGKAYILKLKAIRRACRTLICHTVYSHYIDPITCWFCEVIFQLLWFLKKIGASRGKCW